MQSQAKTQMLVPGSNLVPPEASSSPHGPCNGVWTLGVNLLEGTRVPMYLVIVSADVGNDPRHSYQDDNVDLRESREREAVRGRVHPQDAGTCPAVATPPPTENTSRGFQQYRYHLNLPHKHRGRKNECDFGVK